MCVELFFGLLRGRSRRAADDAAYRAATCERTSLFEWLGWPRLEAERAERTRQLEADCRTDHARVLGEKYAQRRTATARSWGKLRASVNVNSGVMALHANHAKLSNGGDTISDEPPPALDAWVKAGQPPAPRDDSDIAEYWAAKALQSAPPPRGRASPYRALS